MSPFTGFMVVLDILFALSLFGYLNVSQYPNDKELDGK